MIEVGYFPSSRSLRLLQNRSRLGSGETVSFEGRSGEEQNVLAYFRMVTFLPLPDQKHEGSLLPSSL